MILNLFKPVGITSYDCIRILKFIFRYPDKFSHIPEWQEVIEKYEGGKIGHAGTLDPFAEGVLIICTDKDTKKISEIQSMQKEYIAGIKFGFVSDTYDVDGNIQQIEKSCELSQKDIQEMLVTNFTGEISQTPPSFSAKKINGERAYKLARAGKSVKLEPKKVLIYNIGVNKYEYPDLEITVNCGSGTYIRSIAHDLGQELNNGAYCHSLIRTKIGEYDFEKSIKLPPDQIEFIINNKQKTNTN